VIALLIDKNYINLHILISNITTEKSLNNNSNKFSYY